MDESLLEIREYDGEGYKALVDYEQWRVAILRYLDELQPDRIDTMERHTETDEVFVLLRGQGILLMGGNEVWVNGIYPQFMEHGKIYNVKCNTWHTIILNRDASVLLVENRDTGRHNSEYTSLTKEQRHSILEIAQHIITSGNGVVSLKPVSPSSS
jgi:mannose-6-phosphate isomerase-like protein (cupin superfamily)